MNIKHNFRILALLLLVLVVELACGTFRVGIVSSGDNMADEVTTEKPSVDDSFVLDSEQTPESLATDEPLPEPSEESGATAEPLENVENISYTIAYIGNDGNLWATSLDDGENRQITMDATNPTSDGTAPDVLISYSLPKISSDGRYVAIRRDEGHSVEFGLDFTFSLMVYDLETGGAVQAYDQIPVGYDWKPGSHLLAFGQAFSEEYFATRGQPDATFANSIFEYDMNTRASVELVPPDGGYAMSSPRWSPNGRYLAFQEITGYEGSGFFAYYDFETDTYHRWEDRIGLLTWSADSTQIAYDRLTYTATGEERIFIRDLTGGEEQLVTSGITSGYAFAPAISPLGDRIAYFTHDGVRDFEVYTLYIRMLSNGETIEIGEFSNIQQPEWSSDGSLLTFSSGTYGTQQVITVSVEDGSFSVVAEGSIPTIAAISQ